MFGDNRFLSFLVFFLDTLVDAYKTFIALVFISEGIVASIDFAYLLHD